MTSVKIFYPLLTEKTTDCAPLVRLLSSINFSTGFIVSIDRSLDVAMLFFFLHRTPNHMSKRTHF